MGYGIIVTNNPVNWIDPWGLCGENKKPFIPPFDPELKPKPDIEPTFPPKKDIPFPILDDPQDKYLPPGFGKKPISKMPITSIQPERNLWNYLNDPKYSLIPPGTKMYDPERHYIIPPNGTAEEKFWGGVVTVGIISPLVPLIAIIGGPSLGLSTLAPLFLP